MSDEALTVRASKRVQAGDPIPKSRQVVTVLFYRHLLAGAGLQRFLAETCFDGAMVASDEASLVLCCSTTPPDLVILDGDFSGPTTEVVRTLKEQYPEMRLVLVAERFDLDFVLQGYAAGVDGFCSSESGRDLLIRSLELVMLGEPVLPTAMVFAALNRLSVSPMDTLREGATEIETNASNKRVRSLSTREAEILRCLIQGDSNKAIARKFDVAEATVKVHLKAILRKIRVANRTQAAMWAVANMPATIVPYAGR